MGGVAPDGGYGWVVVVAYSISNILVIPMLQGFGLLYRSVFTELQFTATDISTIINVNSAFGMILGLWNGPLLKTFGYRKMAIAGGLMTFVGLIMTSRANSLLQFILFYGLLPSYGFVALLASFSLAQNTYFIKRRSFASGIGMTLTGLGPIIMPLVISRLLKIYDVRGTGLIMAAITFHCLPAALLLHPIKWHYAKTTPGQQVLAVPDDIKVTTTIDRDASVSPSPVPHHDRTDDVADKDDPALEEETALIDNKNPVIISSGMNQTDCERAIDIIDRRAKEFEDSLSLAQQPELFQSVGDLEGILQPRRVSLSISVRERGCCGSAGVSTLRLEETPDGTWWRNSQDSVFQSAQSIPQLYNDKCSNRLMPLRALANGSILLNRSKSCSDKCDSNAKDDSRSARVTSNGGNRREKLEDIEDEDEGERRWYTSIVRYFDLDLLKDPIYFNIWLGMSIAFTGEINFSLMTPIILGDRGFDIENTAKLMSVIASADIVSRFISPFIGKWTKLSARNMYLVALLMLIGSRTLLTLVSSYESTIIVCGLLGMSKGVRSVYMTLVIPNHVSLEKLPSASSLQTVLNGIFLSVFGPLLGYLRDYSGNYNNCIHMINLFTMTTVVLWTIEIIIISRRQRKKRRESAKAAKDAEEEMPIKVQISS